MTVEVRLAPDSFDPATELAAITSAAAGAGAVVSFVGLARGQGRDGAAVESLFLDHHQRLTEQSLVEIAAAATERFDVAAIRIVHRCGTVAAGEAIVFAAAAARHRRAAFEAADYLMDRLKTDAVFWKREDGVDGSHWIEPTEADRADRARWKS